MALKPALEAAKVEDVPTGKLLCASALNLGCVGLIPNMHFFPANDACVFPIEFFGSCIWVLVHILESLAVTNEGVEPLEERPGCHKPVPNNVDRETIEHEEDAEEGRVDAKFEEV